MFQNAALVCSKQTRQFKLNDELNDKSTSDTLQETEEQSKV